MKNQKIGVSRQLSKAQIDHVMLSFPENRASMADYLRQGVDVTSIVRMKYRTCCRLRLQSYRTQPIGLTVSSPKMQQGFLQTNLD